MERQTAQPAEFGECRKRDDCHPGFWDLQLDASQQEAARTKAVLKPPHLRTPQQSNRKHEEIACHFVEL
jgi:hypothetical protein